MTKPINVSVNNKTFEVRIVIKDENGNRVRMPKDFFKNANPAEFVNLSGKLLKSFEKHSQITWLDRDGAVYKGDSSDTDPLSKTQKKQWKKIEDYLLARYSNLPEDAFTEEAASNTNTPHSPTSGRTSAQMPGTAPATNPQQQPGNPPVGHTTHNTHPTNPVPSPALPTPQHPTSLAGNHPSLPHGQHPAAQHPTGVPNPSTAAAARQTLTAQENAAQIQQAQTLEQMRLAVQNNSFSKPSSNTPSYGELVHRTTDDLLDWVLDMLLKTRPSTFLK